MSVYRMLGIALLAGGFATAAPAIAAAHHPHHRATHISRRHVGASRRVSAGIPQHGGGDRDADNSGGPSDGDGNV